MNVNVNIVLVSANRFEDYILDNINLDKYNYLSN